MATKTEAEAIRAQVIESRRAQGLADHVTDPATLAQLARDVTEAAS